MAQRSSEDRGSNTGLGNFDVALINSKLERKNEKEVRNCTIIIICDCECKKVITKITRITVLLSYLLGCLIQLTP